MKVISMEAYKTRKGERKTYAGLISEIRREKRTRQKIYMASEMEPMAERILRETETCGSNATPIVAIAKNMGLCTFHKKLPRRLSGCVEINKKHGKKYGTDRIIFVDPKTHPYEQRFAIACELAHFLFDYDGESEKYRHARAKKGCAAGAETRADEFAMSLLMPREKFIAEYEKAKSMNPRPVFVATYLSDIFKMPVNIVLKRIVEVGRYI